MLLFALVPLGWPHAGAPLESIDVHRPDPGGQTIALESSIGWLWGREGGAFEWICHEAITAPDVLRVPRYVVNRDGVMLARILDPDEGREAGEGLYVSEDGCDWTPAAGLTGRTLAAHASHPGDPSRAFVVTADITDNDLLYSGDAGASFQESELADLAVQFTSVVAEPEGPVWAAATDAAGGAWVYHSADGVTGWSAHALAGTGPLTLHAARDGVAWGGMGALTEQQVLRLEDAGATVTVVWGEGRSVTDIAAHADGALWVAVANGYLYSADGETFEEGLTLPGLGVTVGDDDEVWLATRFELTNYALAKGSWGGGFTPVFTFYDLAGPPERCGPETHVGAICPGDWETLGPRLNLEPTDSGLDSQGADTGGVTGDKPCGCAAGGGGGAWLIGLLALSRRRAGPGA